MPLPTKRTKLPTRPLNLSEMRAFLRAGHTLILKGVHIAGEADLPDLDELAAVSPEAADQSAREMRAEIDRMRRQSDDLERALERIGQGEDPEKVVADRKRERARSEAEPTGAGRSRTWADFERRPPGVPEFAPPPPPSPTGGDPPAGELKGIDPRRLGQPGVDVDPDDPDEDELEEPAPPTAGAPGSPPFIRQGEGAAQPTGGGTEGAVAAAPPRPTVTGPAGDKKADTGGTGMAGSPPVEVQETGAGPKPPPPKSAGGGGGKK
jgi:hypothetical protein